MNSTNNMKGTKIIALIILMSVFPFSCSNRNGKIQVIDTQANNIAPTNLSEVFIKTSQVTLGNTTSLINRIDKVFKTESYIFILDGKVGGSRILQFDHQGNYIQQIGSVGHGPGQYIHIVNFTVDTGKNILFVSADRRILCYGDGRFIRSVPTNIAGNWNSAVLFMTVEDGQLWSFEGGAIPANKESFKWKYQGDLIRYNELLEVIDTTTIIETYYKLDIFSNISGHFISNLKEKMYIYFPIRVPEPFLRDTLFEFRDLKKLPAMKFDFADILVINENVNLKYNPTFPEVREASRKIRNVTINNIYRTDRFVFVDYSNEIDESFLFCYNEKKQECFNMTEGFTDDIFGIGSTVKLLPLDLAKGEFCFVKNGYELDGVMDGVNENSNPVIFFVRTKEGKNNEEMKK